MVHIENQFKRVVITKNKISTIIYIKGVQSTASDVKFGDFEWRNYCLHLRKIQSPKINTFSNAKRIKFVINFALKILISKKEEKSFHMYNLA